MDISNLKRNPDAVKQDLKSLAGDTVITKGGCKVYIPARFAEQKLASFGSDTYILGYFAIVLPNGDYGTTLVPGMIKTQPDKINTVKINDEQYAELEYFAGSPVIANSNIVQDSKLLYSIWNEFFTKGAIPWYMNYEDQGRIFKLSKMYAGTKLGANSQIIEMVAAVVSRDEKDMNVQFRQTLKTERDYMVKRPKPIKLLNVSYGATNTTAKLIGGYWEEGLTSALINPSKSVEPIEKMLRQ